MFSTTWAMQYWYLCLIALLIGIATGWWIWARLRAVAATRSEPALSRTATVPPAEPVSPRPAPQPAPEPVRPQPVSPQPVRAAVSEGGGGGGGPRIAAAVGTSDDLELIKGVGPALNGLLNSLGVRRFDQIAAWTAAETAEVDAHLGAFRGRIARDNWVDQAGYLARGDIAGFTAKYGDPG